MLKMAMAMDETWLAMLPKARTTVKYAFTEIHILAHLRKLGVAPVVLFAGEFWRVPPQLEALFELCLRHLHCMKIPWPTETQMTVHALLADRAMEALKLPARFIPVGEDVVDLGDDATNRMTLVTLT